MGAAYNIVSTFYYTVKFVFWMFLIPTKALCLWAEKRYRNMGAQKESVQQPAVVDKQVETKATQDLPAFTATTVMVDSEFKHGRLVYVIEPDGLVKVALQNVKNLPGLAKRTILTERHLSSNSHEALADLKKDIYHEVNRLITSARTSQTRYRQH